MISTACLYVTGIDISADAIAYAAKRYHAQNLSFLPIKRVELGPLPFGDEQFDVILSFQVIEHIKNISAYLDEAHRVLKTGGIFMVATPDRTTRLFPHQKPWNRFHVLEYDGPGLRQTLASRFADIKLFHMSGTNLILQMELSRTKRLRWITLPFTFPGAPEWLRTSGLNFLHLINERVQRSHDNDSANFEFDERDVVIGIDKTPSVNIIALAKK